jgi:hypothetical protein
MFDRELAGKNGVVVKQRLTGGDWMPVDDRRYKLKGRNDIVTTLDVDLQDVVQRA